jgi:LuxR family transcriptional regulator, maltose regulon positive regulatory protein
MESVKKTIQYPTAALQSSELVALDKAFDETAVYVNVGAWKQAADALECAIPRALRISAFDRLSQLIGQFPAQAIADRPWLTYAGGVALSDAHDPRAPALLDLTYESFDRASDARGKLLAAAARVDGQIRSRRTHAGLETWIECLEKAHSQFAFEGDIETELRASSALLAGLLYFQPDSSVIESLAQRTLTLARMSEIANDTLTAATYLLGFAELTQRADVFAQANSLASAAVQSEAASAMRIGEWLSEFALITTFQCSRSNVADDALTTAIDRATRWVDEHSLHNLAFKIDRVRYELLRIQYKPEEATAVLTASEASIPPQNLIDWLTYFYKRSELCVVLHQPDDAIRFSESARQLCEETGTSRSRRSTYIAMHAMALAQAERFEESIARYDELIGDAAPKHRPIFESVSRCLQAHLAWDRDRQHALQLLRDGLAQQRSFGSKRLFWYSPNLAATTLDRALANGIEPDFVRSVIATRELAPPQHASAAWPWTLRIRALGGFSIELNETSVAFEGKAQRRPLELLKALVIGGRDGIAVEALLQRLFPSTEHEDPKGSFEVSLYRLRKLLGGNAAIRFQCGKLSLDPALIWIDLTHFENACDALLRADNIERLLVDADNAFRLFDGPLFGDDCPAFARARRDGVRRRAEQLVEKAALAYEQHTRYDEAIVWWDRGLRIEPLSEAFYRGLMRCHAASGNASGALAHFRRCAEVLANMLAIAPSAETEQLRAKIHRSASA